VLESLFGTCETPKKGRKEGGREGRKEIKTFVHHMKLQSEYLMLLVGEVNILFQLHS
jgi:hypothetical protein